jgi:uncharacterized membrane protein YkvA (DUF1232 family)
MSSRGATMVMLEELVAEIAGVAVRESRHGGVLRRIASGARSMRSISPVVIPRVPWHTKVITGSVAAYAFSPIDLLPDFIPVIGYLDDLVHIPLGVLAVRALIPDPVMADDHLWRPPRASGFRRRAVDRPAR